MSKLLITETKKKLGLFKFQLEKISLIVDVVLRMKDWVENVANYCG